MGLTKLFSSVNLFRSTVNSSRLLLRRCSGKTNDECDAKTGKEQSSSSEGSKSGLVLGVYEAKDKFELSAAAEEINLKSGGKICKYLNEFSCELKLGKAFVVTDVVPEFSAVAISSLGKKDPGYNKLEELDETKENVRVMVGAGVRALCERGCERVAVDGAASPHAAAEAAYLAAYHFEEFKTSSDKHPEVQLSLYGSECRDQWDTGSIYGQGQNWARYLSDMPANKMEPVDLAQAALDTLCPLGVQVSAHEREWLQAQRMRGVLAVAAGSCAPPLLLHCRYRGSGRPPVLLAADGLTFDCGGLCLKSAERMRGATVAAGAAAVLGAMLVIARLKVPINVEAVVPLCEQLVSGHCLKVGDVIPALNGLNIQVDDTDLESQLLLADALVYGQTMAKPSLVIDVASLTDGTPLATGDGPFACFSNSAGAWRAVRDAGARTGDRPWRYPLWDYFARQIRDNPAVDLTNKGSGTATPCKGAAFLRHFVCGEWLHMETTGVCRAGAGAPPYLRAGRAAGRPARTLAAFLAAAAEHSARGDQHSARGDQHSASADQHSARGDQHCARGDQHS